MLMLTLCVSRLRPALDGLDRLRSLRLLFQRNRRSSGVAESRGSLTLKWDISVWPGMCLGSLMRICRRWISSQSCWAEEPVLFFMTNSAKKEGWSMGLEHTHLPRDFRDS